MTAPMSQHPDGSEPARGRRDPLPEHPDDRPEGLSDPRLPAHDLPQRESLDAIIAARLTRVELEPDRRARILAVLNSPQPRSADVSPAKAVAADRPRRTTWRRIPALAASAAVVIAIVALVWATIPSKWDRLEPQLLAQLAQQKWQPSNRWQTLPFESESAPPVSRFLRAARCAGSRSRPSLTLRPGSSNYVTKGETVACSCLMPVIMRHGSRIARPSSHRQDETASLSPPGRKARWSTC